MENEDLKKADRLICSLTMRHAGACRIIAELEEELADWKFRFGVLSALFGASVVALAIGPLS